MREQVRGVGGGGGKRNDNDGDFDQIANVCHVFYKFTATTTVSRQLLFCIRIRNRSLYLYLYLQLYLQLHPHDSTCASIKCSGVRGSVIVASVSHAPSIVHWYLLRLFGWTKGCGGVVGVGCVCFNGIELALLCSPCLYVWQDEPQSIWLWHFCARKTS